MSLLARLLGKQKTEAASVAKERLQVIIAQTGSHTPDYLPQLRHDIMQVIAKYVSISADDILVNVTKEGEEAVLELNVPLPEMVE